MIHHDLTHRPLGKANSPLVAEARISLPIARSATKRDAQEQLLQQRAKTKNPKIISSLYDLRPWRNRPPPMPGMPNHVESMPDDVILLILAELELLEKIKLRRVCRRWKAVVEGWLSGCGQYVKLNIKELVSVTSKWSPAHSLRRMQFAGVWSEPADKGPGQTVSLTIPIESFNEHAAKWLGSVFSKLQILLIYYDAQDTKAHIANVVHLLSSCSPDVHTFALIMSPDQTAMKTVAKICAAIKENMSALRRLDLFVNPLKAVKGQPDFELDGCAPTLMHFGCTGMPKNHKELLKLIGVKNEQTRVSEGNSQNDELASLSIQLRPGVNKNKAVQFEANPEYARVKRLQLTNISSRATTESYLKQFSNVQNLQLYFTTLGVEHAVLDQKWISTIQKAPKVTELTLVYMFPDLNLTLTAEDRLPNVKKLTIGPHFIMILICMRSQLYTRKFLDTICNVFPNLEEITVQTGFREDTEVESEVLRYIFLKRHNFKQVNIDLSNPNYVPIPSQFLFGILKHLKTYFHEQQ